MNRTITLFLSAVLLICFTSSKPLHNNSLHSETRITTPVDDCVDDTTTMNGSTTDIPVGSIIIDMGVTSQSFDNGIKPYGLIYSLIKNYNAPVYWSINANKAKDGVDFSVDGKNFKGGPFVISKQYLTTGVISEINQWRSQGVVTHTTMSNVTIPLYKELTFYPTWVLDKKNGKIAENYLKNAGIPQSAYTTALPATLNECHDLFVLPHAEPTWKDHGYLLKWNSAIAEGGNQGFIWSGCTAASNLENLYNPSNPSQQMNFLSSKIKNATNNGDDYFENALVLADNHDDASNTRHNTAHHEDPFMQFLGQSDGVHKSGKEEIYLPVNGGGWRPTTKVGLWDTNQKDLGKLSPGKAALMLYGPAFGDTNRGQIMYQAGHDLNKKGTTEERVAAQRGFLNFSFDAAAAKVPQIVMNNPEQREVTLTNGESITFDVTGIPILGGGITYEWSSTCVIGSFDNTSSPTPTFTIPNTPEITSNQSCIVTVKATDECGRLAFLTYKINFIVKPINCDITAISAANSTSCNDNGTSTSSDDFFTTDVTVTFSNPPTTGLLFLSGDTGINIPVDQLDSVTSHTFIGVQFPADGGQVSLTAFFIKDVQEEEVACSFDNSNVIIAPESCSYTPCSITAIAASNNSPCNDNGTSDANDDFFITDITVTFSSAPTTGLLFLSGDATMNIPVDQLDSTTSHRFTGLQFPANGQEVSLTAYFIKDVQEEEIECSFDNTAVLTAPESCSYTPCSITAIAAANSSSCNDNGTSDANDDFFTTDITVTFSSAPTTGLLFLSGDAAINIPVDQLDSANSHTFTGVQFAADGGQVSLTAFFIKDVQEEEIACSFDNNAVLMAPESCSYTPCNISAISASNNSSCNNNGTETSDDDFFTSDITVTFSTPPTTGVLKLVGYGTTTINVSELDSTTSHTFVGIQLPTNDNSIDLTAFFIVDDKAECIFNATAVVTAPLPCSDTTCNITTIYASNNSSCDDNGTETQSDNFFTTDITVLFTSPPTTGFLLLTGDLSITINVNELDSNTSHTFTNIQLPADGDSVNVTAQFMLDVQEEEAECTFNNSSVIIAPICCTVNESCAISSISALNSSSCNNNDTAIATDDYFTADIQVEFSSRPITGILKLTGDSTISVDVSQLDSDTSHTFIGIQFPADGNSIDLTALFTGAEGVECSYNNTTVMTAPTSCSFNPCAISAISAANSSSCNDNGTSDIPTDDYFTSDITVLFSSLPSTGVLKLTGDGTATIDVSQLDSETSHTFVGVKLPANGSSIELTTFFMVENTIECAFNDAEVLTAPSSCSISPCNISAISGANVICNNNSNIVNVDITVSFTSPPSDGFLEIIGEGLPNSKVRVGKLDSNTSHTFVGVQLPGGFSSISLTAFFMTETQESECTFNDSIEIECEEEDEDEGESLVGDQIDFKGLSIHPNPSKGKITIDTPNISGNVRVDIYDLTGKLILNKYTNPKNKQIEIRNLPKGVLLVRLKSKGNSIMKKIIID